MTVPIDDPISDKILVPIDDSTRIESLIKAIEEFDVTTSEGWGELDELSSRTELQGVEPEMDGFFQRLGNNNFEVIGNVYVLLNYDGKKNGLSMADTYPFHAYGRFDGEEKAIIEQMVVDTSSFYE